MKTCESCHYGDMPFTAETFSDKCGPYINKPADCPNWEPMTNADKVRNMSDVDLARTFAKTCGGTVGQYLEWLRKTE